MDSDLIFEEADGKWKILVGTQDLRREAKTVKRSKNKISCWGRGWALFRWEQDELFAWVFPEEGKSSILETTVNSP